MPGGGSRHAGPRFTGGWFTRGDLGAAQSCHGRNEQQPDRDITVKFLPAMYPLRLGRFDVSVFGLRRRSISSYKPISIRGILIDSINNLSGPKPGHIPGGSILGGVAHGATGRRGEAGTGSTGRRRDCSPRRKQHLFPPRDDRRMSSWV